MSDNFSTKDFINKIINKFEIDLIKGGLMGSYRTEPGIDTFPSKSTEDDDILHDANLGLKPVKEETYAEVDCGNSPNLSQKKTVYSGGEIHAAFRTCALDYMKEYENYEIDEKEKLRKERLERLGFTSSEALEIYKEKLCVVCFQWFENYFPGCIFLPTDKFVTLLNQYNLVCGRLEEYKGNISDDNLKQVTQVKDTLIIVRDNNPYSNRLDNGSFHVMITGINNFISECYLKNRQTLEALRFPFESELAKTISSLPNIYIETIPTYSTQLFIAAFAKDMKTVAEYIHPYTHSEGPFIFQLTPYGVVIFSK